MKKTFIMLALAITLQHSQALGMNWDYFENKSKQPQTLNQIPQSPQENQTSPSDDEDDDEFQKITMPPSTPQDEFEEIDMSESIIVIRRKKPAPAPQVTLANIPQALEPINPIPVSTMTAHTIKALLPYVDLQKVVQQFYLPHGKTPIITLPENLNAVPKTSTKKVKHRHKKKKLSQEQQEYNKNFPAMFSLKK